MPLYARNFVPPWKQQTPVLEFGDLVNLDVRVHHHVGWVPD